MRHQVYRYIWNLLDVNDFLGTTHKWGKKFYTVRVEGGEYPGGETSYLIRVKAIGISRDLVARIEWVMEAKSHGEGKPGPDAIRKNDAPIQGFIPTDKKALLKLYPNFGHVPDEPGEYHWITIFESWGFKLVDNISVIE